MNMSSHSVILEHKQKEIVVSLLLTESTASALDLKMPYLEDLHPDESRIYIITPSETNYNRNASSSHNVYYRGTDNIDNKSLLSDVAYLPYGSFSSFSSRLGLVEAASIPTDSGQLCIEKDPPCVLQPTKVHTRPLVTVRSMAHEDKLDVHLGKIYVSLLNSQTSLTSDLICRICHGGESIDDLLTPCRCRGTVALVHLGCLERWLLESSRSHCELCQHHYEIIREPKYNFFWSILMFLKNPGSHLRELLVDLVSFVAYTPSAIVSTYMLMMICESVARSDVLRSRSVSAHVIAFSAIFGIAIIDFTYTSWLMLCLQRHVDAWKEWYKQNSSLHIILPKAKRKPRKVAKKMEISSTTVSLLDCT